MEQVDNFDLESKTKWCVGSNPTSPTIMSRVAVGGRFASVNTDFESLNYHWLPSPTDMADNGDM